MSVLNDYVLSTLEAMKADFKPTDTDEYYYMAGCGCTGNCGQSCTGGCLAGCSGNCGRSCSGSGS